MRAGCGNAWGEGTQGLGQFGFSLPPLAALPSLHPLLDPFWGSSQTTGSFIAQTKAFLSAAATVLYGPHLFRRGECPSGVFCTEQRVDCKSKVLWDCKDRSEKKSWAAEPKEIGE